MTQEVMKQALETLELVRSSHNVMLLSDPPQYAWKTRGVDFKILRAITSLRTALKQPEKEPVKQPAPMSEPNRAIAYAASSKLHELGYQWLNGEWSQQAEPVQYEMRMRPTWEANSWSAWQKCSKESAGDYIKSPKLHDWLYEVRALYTQPPQRTPLTEEKIKDCLDAADQMYCERDGDKEVFKARAIEAAHNIKE